MNQAKVPSSSSRGLEGKMKIAFAALLLAIVGLTALGSTVEEDSATAPTTSTTTTSTEVPEALEDSPSEPLAFADETTEETTESTGAPATTTTSSTTTAEPPATTIEELDDPASGWTEDDTEYLLAIIDRGGHVELDDPIIDSYSDALDSVLEGCVANDRRHLADMVVYARETLREESVPTTTLDLLEGLRIATSSEVAEGQECASTLSVLMVLMIEG